MISPGTSTAFHKNTYIQMRSKSVSDVGVHTLVCAGWHLQAIHGKPWIPDKIFVNILPKRYTSVVSNYKCRFVGRGLQTRSEPKLTTLTGGLQPPAFNQTTKDQKQESSKQVASVSYLKTMVARRSAED